MGMPNASKASAVPKVGTRENVMNGDRVRIIAGPGAGHEGVIVAKNGGHFKVRTQDFGSGGLQPRVIVKGRHEIEAVRVYSEFQGRPFVPYVPPRVSVRTGALDFKACPSVFGDGK